jgi:hypothetical protein
VVLTASAATEYSFEGDPTDAAIPAGSVFPATLVQGLRTGAAATDHDGHVSANGWAAAISSTTPQIRPGVGPVGLGTASTIPFSSYCESWLTLLAEGE